VPLVSIEQDAKYRRDRDGCFIEVCRACRLDRTGDTCSCGMKFERLARGFFTLEWTPTSVEPDMPPLCPHCARRPDRLRSVTIKLPTARGVFTQRTLEFESCKKMLPPFLAYLLLVTAIFFTVVFGLAVVFGNWIALIPLAGSIAAIVGAWRAYGWLRFAGFDQRSIRLRVRRPEYAQALAEKNAGRVV
jgi:hypothetical protein